MPNTPTGLRKSVSAVPTFTLRADDGKHLDLLVLALRAAETTRSDLVPMIRSIVRMFECYQEALGNDSGCRAEPKDPEWHRF